MGLQMDNNFSVGWRWWLTAKWKVLRTKSWAPWVAVVVSLLSAFSSWRSSQIAKEQADRAMLTQRASVTLNSVQMSPLNVGTPIQLDIVVRNTGTTPALRIEGVGVFGIASSIEDAYQKLETFPLPKASLGAGQEMQARGSLKDSLTDEQYQAIQNHSKSIFAVLKLRYHDEFGEAPRCTRISREWVPETRMLVPAGTGDELDTDCDR
jgi:hypothetical protein